MYVDIGAYGPPQAVKDKREDYDTIAHSKNIEKYVGSIHGFQMLYATSYLTRDEFRKMFNHSHYDEMKKRYDPNGAFPEVFEKTCKEGNKKLMDNAAKPQ